MNNQELDQLFSRAASCSDAVNSDWLEDDFRMYTRLQPTFMGRAVYPFEYADEHESVQARKAADFVRTVKRLVPGVVIQGVFSETIFPTIDRIEIPSWVFDAFEMPTENRCFRYARMFDTDFAEAYDWSRFGEGGTVLDITLHESQLWWYYRNRTFIDAGCEAIHLGQPHLYARKDRGYTVLRDLLGRLRAYGTQAADRGFILLDAHSHGLSVDGVPLLDFCSRPISAVPGEGTPERLILQLKGRNQLPDQPYLVEVDNWGGRIAPEETWDDAQARKDIARWGWDDITWFAHQSRDERTHFLQYAMLDCLVRDRKARFQVPLHRTLGNTELIRGGAATRVYCANNPSETCPVGWGDEDTILALWNRDRPELPVDPPLGEQQPRTVRSADGVDIITPAVMVGSIQAILGGRPGDTCCPHSRLPHQGDGVFARTVPVPRAGEYSFKIILGSTQTENFDSRGLSGPQEVVFQTGNDLSLVRVTFEFDSRRISVEPIEYPPLQTD